MSARGVISMTTAPAGSGKTYRRGPHFLMTEFLKEADGRVHWSNLPLNVDKICDEMARKTGRDRSEFEKRIRVIPEQTMQHWREGVSGPWEFFAAVDLDGAHIAIDEFHECCGSNKSKELRAQYQLWFGQIRHRGATIEVISQSPEKIAKEIHFEAAIKRSLVNSEDRRDPWFGILFGDWYELRAAWVTREYISAVWELESRNADGKWVVEDKRVFWFDQYYYPFYNSYSKPSDAKVAGQAKKREFQKRSRWGLTWWFIQKNAIRLSTRAAVIGFAVWFLALGGLGRLMANMNQSFQSLASKHTAMITAGHAAASQPTQTASEADTATTRPKFDVPAAPVSDAGVGHVLTVKAASVPVAEGERAELEAMHARVKELEEQQAGVVERVVAMTAETVALSDGQVYRVGDVVISGPLDGRKLEKINFARRVAVFGGRQIGMVPPGNVLRGLPSFLSFGASRPGAGSGPAAVQVPGKPAASQPANR